MDENETLEVGAENTDKENEEKVNVPKAEEKEDDDEVLIIKEGKKEVVVMEIDIDDDDVGKQKNNSVTLSEEDGSKIVNGETKKTDNNVIEKETINNVEHDKKDCNDDRTALDSSNVPSPIIIDEDSTFLPGLTDETEGGVFGFALGSGSDSQPDRSTQESVEKKIIYEPMKFDMPPIKLEPPDEELSSDNAPLNPDEFLSTFTPFLPVGSGNPDEAEPMNIDLTEEDSVDAVESCARPAVTQIRTSIDGNLQHEGKYDIEKLKSHCVDQIHVYCYILTCYFYFFQKPLRYLLYLRQKLGSTFREWTRHLRTHLRRKFQARSQVEVGRVKLVLKVKNKV